jgi:hypothetical protein
VVAVVAAALFPPELPQVVLALRVKMVVLAEVPLLPQSVMAVVVAA